MLYKPVRLLIAGFSPIARFWSCEIDSSIIDGLRKTGDAAGIQTWTAGGVVSLYFFGSRSHLVGRPLRTSVLTPVLTCQNSSPDLPSGLHS